MFGVFDIARLLIVGVKDHIQGRQAIKKASMKRQEEMASDQQSHNQSWELKQLDNSGWKDDVLFYSFIGMFIWAGFDPDGAKVFFENLKVLPEWFVEIFMVLTFSVIGIKKGAEYLPALIDAVKKARQNE